MIKRLLEQKLKEKFPGVDFDILIPPDSKMGDYSINIAFVLAVRNHGNTESAENAEEIAKKLVKELKPDKDFADVFEKIEAVKPGFVNFSLKRKFVQKRLEEIYESKDSFGGSDAGKGKTVIIEYGGTNIAKPMHVGHLRSVIIGDGLANVYQMLGYKIIRWNYIGDWGTQFGKLIAAYKLWGDDKKLKEQPIQTMLDLYVKFHNELKNNPDLESQGREEFRKLEKGDRENRKLWEIFRSYSLEEFDKIFRQLEIKFDIIKGESGYEEVISETVGLLERAGILKKSEGADIVEFNPPDGGLPPALICKSDGTSLYLTRDIASLKERIEKHNPDKILYVVANQQALHFEQLFAIAKMLGWTGIKLAHIKFGMVLGEDRKKLATREGKVIPLQELIDKIISLSLEVVKNKNPELSDKETKDIARAVSMGALKYNDLKQHPHTDIVFDWKAMLNISGNSGPYLQYAYARLASILEKSNNRRKGDASLLTASEEEKLMKRLLKFPDVIANCAEVNALNGLALYLYELANETNRFYESIRVLDDENAERLNARLMLVETAATVLEKGLNLIGIKALKRI